MLSRPRIRWSIAIGAVILVVAAVLGRPAKRKFNEYRSRSLLDQSREYVSRQDWKPALQRAEAALQLQPESLQVMRHLFSVYVNLRHPAAVTTGARICAHDQTPPVEQAEVLSLILELGRPDAFRMIYDALDDRTRQHREVRWAHSRWLSWHDPARAQEELGSLIAESPEPRFQLGLAQLLLAQSQESATKRARELLTDLMISSDRAVAIGAARLVGKMRPTDVTPAFSSAVRECIRGHQASTADDKLFAYTLEIRDNRDQRAAIIARAVKELGATEIPSLAHWLTQIGDAGRAREVLTREMATSDVAAFEIYFAALMVDGQWEEAEQWLESSPPALDPVRLNTFKAVVAIKRGDSKSANRHWTNALSQAAWDKSSNHYQRIYEMAETSDADEVAMEALLGWYRSDSLILPDLSHAERLLTWLSNSGRERDMLAVLEKLQKRGVRHPSITNTLAYFQILHSRDVRGAVAELHDLVERYPGRLEYRTSLALGRLELGEPAEALQALTGDPAIDWSRTSDSARAVYVRILEANDRAQEAEAVDKTIDPAKLLPQERLILREKTARTELQDD